ncbi:hypothetical protein PIIN_10789 [Serendipita indica DSM 11827]|uniref:Uncharacterized protein n=1 Tax=Serendipita indica (strain DSM 11827) TaxID=1109443 RepID=G4TZR0_SERID|nr:hypothetical protein PIIN_10789 [Serendipita indica DSM 11827]
MIWREGSYTPSPGTVIEISAHNTLPLEHVQFGFEVYSPPTFFPVKLSNLPPQGVASAACIPREDSNVVSHEPLHSVSPVRDVDVTCYLLNLHASVVPRKDVAPLSIVSASSAETLRSFVEQLTPMHLILVPLTISACVLCLLLDPDGTIAFVYHLGL